MIDMVLDLINRLIRRVGSQTLLSLLLLLVALGSVAVTLADTVRELDLLPVLLLTVGGLLLGWGLAAAWPVPGWLAAILSFVLGAEAIVLWIGRLDRNVAMVGQSLANLAWQLWRWPLAGAPDVASLAPPLAQLWIDLTRLTGPVAAWFTALAGDKPAFDPLATALIWSLAVWAVSVWAGWSMRRLERPLLAMLPAGALLATTLAHTLKQVDMLLPLLGATLLLLGLTGHTVRERRWQANKIDSPDIQPELAAAIIAISVAAVVLAASIPSISINTVTGFSRQLFGYDIARAEPVLGSLGLRSKSGRATALTELRAPGLPRSHLLGSGPELSEQIALIINTTQFPSDPAGSDLERPVPRYYWRSITYDTYNGRGWQTSETEQIKYKAGQTATPAQATTRYVLRQQIQVANNQGSLLHAAGDIVTADHDYRIDWRRPGDPFAAIIDTSNYQVDSLVPAVDKDELRAAGSDYPDSIQQHFLQLPGSVPERVLTLAQDLTAGAPTPYDQAKAIESHLRTFPYNLDLPYPPANRDMVDYFLFDLQQGYCDYYATSMVVLARAAGLPARMAIGYASGTYDSDLAQYVVTEAEAHSWVEIYFPEYGWIEFEPTAAQPVTDRSGQIPQPEPVREALSPPAPPAPQFSWWLLLPGGLALLAAGGVGWSLVDSWRLRRLAPAAAVITVYERLYRSAGRLAVPLWPGDTPYEFASALAKHVDSLTQGKRWQDVLTPVQPEVQWLVRLYIKTAYSAHPPNAADQRQAIQTWWRLRQRLWLAWVTALNSQTNRRR
jgi:transglutaminase-like putative cysteine protease